MESTLELSLVSHRMCRVLRFAVNCPMYSTISGYLSKFVAVDLRQKLNTRAGDILTVRSRETPGAWCILGVLQHHKIGIMEDTYMRVGVTMTRVHNFPKCPASGCTYITSRSYGGRLDAGILHTLTPRTRKKVEHAVGCCRV